MMTNKKLGKNAWSLIDEYKNFNYNKATCSIPYFNNKTKNYRAALAVNIGKGNPEEIKEELDSIVIKNKIDTSSLSSHDLKKILVDNNIGIDCSGFVYHVLNAESLENKNTPLKKRITFSGNIINKIRAYVRPVANTGVSVLADNKNSKIINISEVLPGDFITMTYLNNEDIRDHIIVIHEVIYENSYPIKLHYSHSIAYAEDGLYSHGVRQNTIQIIDKENDIKKSTWLESGLYSRLHHSTVELRRLK